MKKEIIFGAGAILVLIGLVWYGYVQTQNSTSASNAGESEVRTVVQEFGTKLQMVSLLAPALERKASMDQYYSPYVAPELLSTWYPEGSQALGRYTSSPWPDRIEIVEVRPTGSDFVVEGNVIEVTSTEIADKEAAAVYPVTLTLEQRGGKWLIVKADKGAYSELPQRKTILGFWECLPHKDTTGPQTDECALGIAVDQSDGHYAVNTSLMSTYPVTFATGTKVRITGIVTPANQLSSIQKYDIDGIINATAIEKV